MLGQDSSYIGANNGRSWTPTPQISKNSSSLFLDQDQTYTNGQYATTTYPIRTMSNSDSKNMSLTSMANALPPAITDRLLPYPSTGRQLTQATYLRTNDGQGALQNTVRNMEPIHSYNHGLMSTSMMNTVKAINANSISENASMSSSYLPLSSSGTSNSVGSSQLSCASQYMNTTNQQSGDVYGSSTSSNSLYRQQNDSSSSLSNGYSPSSRKPSQTSDNASSATTLSNGQTYIPYVSQSYPQPPMEEMPTSLAKHRSSDAGIQAS